ncbi:MAG: TPM domain-containing protein, partial [Chitinophagaceae bacterium]
MKNWLTIFALFLLVPAVSQIEKKLPEAPSPMRLVVDQTGTLTADQIDALERKLVAYDDTTSNQIAIVIITTTGDYDIGEFATALGRKWGIGNKKSNNGVLLLVAKDDRTVFIAPGYGLEGALPDITCKQIISDVIVPQFKGNDFFRGLDEGTDLIMKAAAGEYTPPEGYSDRRKRKNPVAGIIILIIILIILFRSRGGGSSIGGDRSFRRPGGMWFPPGGGFGG